VSWIEPKMDWTTSDYFNLDPDYNRIKGNISFIKDFSLQLYADFPMIAMETVTIDGFPFDTFLNNIVDNVTRLETSLYKPPTDVATDRYIGGQVGWNAAELNIIEGNILRLYNAIVGQWNCLNKLEFILGVDGL
jgi:hypothetical protein